MGADEHEMFDAEMSEWDLFEKNLIEGEIIDSAFFDLYYYDQESEFEVWDGIRPCLKNGHRLC